MELRARVLILCLLCIARASEVLSREIVEEGSLADVEDLSRSPVLLQETDKRTDKRPMDKFRDKRALGLLLSGLAQIFGYTVSPIQIASLPNPNTTMPAMPNSTMMGQQVASSRPMPVNATMPRRQETIRFTGVVNFGNNSDIIGHLQRYEQIFHGRGNNTTTTARPASMPSANLSVDLRTTSQTKPPLLTPFFVKIPLPIAPDLLPLPPIEDYKLSYPDPSTSIMNESNEAAELPIQKEEIVYRNNGDTEQYTVEDKDTYDEKDVRKPTSKYTHELYVDEAILNGQQNDRYNELQRKQQEHVARLQNQEGERSPDKNDYDEEDEVNERYKNREEESVDRNRENVSKNESTEKKRPAYDDEEDEDSAGRYNERKGPANLSYQSSKESSERNEKDESYPNYDDDDDTNKEYNGYKQPIQPSPADLNKYIEVGYTQQLPIGDYFHEGNPEDFRDSYGEVLDDKNSEDERLSDYFSMFKHPYPVVHNFQGIPNEASREDEREETSGANGYEEHLNRIQKLREEYALPVPENKYEEYDINDEGEAGRNDRKSERVENRTSARPKTERLRGKEDTRNTKTATGSSSRNQLQDNREAKSEDAKSREEIDFMRYTPLVVPVRYVDTTDKMEQATTRQLKFKEADKSRASSQVSGAKIDVAPTASAEKLAPQTTVLPERPRQLHEGELNKEFQLWPPPFDYAFDNTQQTNAILPANPQSYPLNYYRHVVKDIAANDANSDNSSEQPSGYVVIVGNPVHPYRYPYNIYYFPNEAVNPENRDPHLNADGTQAQDQVYIPQRNVNQQPIRANSDITEYDHNKTAQNHHNYYQSQQVPANIHDRYGYIFGERTRQVNEPSDVEVRNQISNKENWSSRLYRPQSQVNIIDRSPTSVVQPPDIVYTNQNVRSESTERQSYSPRRRKSAQRPKEQRQDDRKVKAPSRQSISEGKRFDDPQSAHDFFGFSKNDYSYDGESDDASKVAEENGKTAENSHVALVGPEPVVYHHDESLVKHADEPENDMEKAKVTEYRNRVATLRVSEQRRLQPNGPTHYVNLIRNI